MTATPDPRFARTELLLGAEACARLRRARVAVAGLGGVGSYAVEALARAGIGRLRIVDFDSWKPSNMNRQLYALESTLGRPKVEIARQRVLDINPACEAEALQIFIDPQTVGQVLAGPPDVLIDAIDSLNPKVELIASAVTARVPVVSSMGAATRTDPLAVRVADISETTVCPLARRIRKKLKQRGIANQVRCIYSIEEPRNSDEETDEPEAGEYERGRKRRPLGSLSYMTGIFGLIAAREAIRIVLAPGQDTG